MKVTFELDVREICEAIKEIAMLEKLKKAQAAAARLSQPDCSPEDLQADARELAAFVGDLSNVGPDSLLSLIAVHFQHPGLEAIRSKVKSMLRADASKGGPRMAANSVIIWQKDAEETLSLQTFTNMATQVLSDAVRTLQIITTLASNASRQYAATGDVHPVMINLAGDLTPGQQAAVKLAQQLGLKPENILQKQDGDEPRILQVSGSQIK